MRKLLSAAAVLEILWEAETPEETIPSKYLP